MADYISDEIAKCERRAKQSLNDKDWPKAAELHFELARLTFALAEKCDPAIRDSYYEKAQGYIDFSRELKSRPVETKKAEVPSPTLAVEGEKCPDADMWPIMKPGNIKMSDVVGLGEAKKEVRDALINYKKHPDIYSAVGLEPGKGLILYGPPGTGKTFFAKAIAGELDTPFINVKCSQVKDKYVGGTEKLVASLFKAARSHGRCVLFLDECDVLLARRGNEKVNAVASFLTELDGVEKSKAQVFVLLATNHPAVIDGALGRSGRISRFIYVGLPDREERKSLIEKCLAASPVFTGVKTEEFVKTLVEKTEGFSSADISADSGGLFHHAKTMTARRWIARRDRLGDVQSGSEEWNRVELATEEDFLEAFKKVVPVSESANNRSIIEEVQQFKAAHASA